MMKSWFFALIPAVLLAGCTSDLKGVNAQSQQSTTKPNQKTEPTQTTTDPSQRPEKPKPGEITKEGIDRGHKVVSERQKGVFDIKPSTEVGFTTAPKAETKNLGASIDSALKNLDPALLYARMEIDADGDLSTSTPEIKIQDAKNFSIQFVDPKIPYEVGSLVSLNGDFAQFQKNGFIQPDTSKPNLKMNHDGVVEWMSNAGYRMFDYYRTGVGSWEALFTAFNDPKNGFETKVDKKIQGVHNTTERPFYRIIISSKTKDKFLGEIVIDTSKNVPVTIRSIHTRPDGKEEKLYWTAGWNFGGKYTDKDFIHPKAKPAP